MPRVQPSAAVRDEPAPAPGGARASETDGRGRRRRACFSVSCPGLLDPGREPLGSLETLAEVGFSIDSSIFPMRTPRYGIADWELAPHRIRLPNDSSILECRLLSGRCGDGGFRWRAVGYFRVLPPALLRRALRAITAEHRPPVIYCHPYEFNPRELDDYRRSVPTRLRVSQGLGRGSFVQRVRTLLRSVPFGRFDDVLTSRGIS
jgi:Domain of unknown function (DUF3473)